MTARNDFPLTGRNPTKEQAQMLDEIDALRARVYELETPTRKRAEMIAWIRDLTAKACARDIHAVTHRVGGRDRCTTCDTDVTEQLKWEIF